MSATVRRDRQPVRRPGRRRVRVRLLAEYPDQPQARQVAGQRLGPQAGQHVPGAGHRRVVICGQVLSAAGPPVGDAHEGLQVGEDERAVPVAQPEDGPGPGPVAAELNCSRSTVSVAAGWPSIAGTRLSRRAPGRGSSSAAPRPAAARSGRRGRGPGRGACRGGPAPGTGSRSGSGDAASRPCNGPSISSSDASSCRNATLPRELAAPLPAGLGPGPARRDLRPAPRRASAQRVLPGLVRLAGVVQVAGQRPRCALLRPGGQA